GVGVREFQGDDVGQVLRLLARQAKINMVVSEQVTGTVTMRLEDVTALQAIAIIVKAKGLFMDEIDHVYYIKTPAEKTAEPTANPKQSYGINWAGVVGSSSNAKTVSYGAPANASVSSSGSSSTSTNGTIPTSDLVLGSAGNHNLLGNFSQLALGQFAILSVPQ